MTCILLKAVSEADDNEDESIRGGGASSLRSHPHKLQHPRSKTGSHTLPSLPPAGSSSDRRPPAIRNLARSVPIFEIVMVQREMEKPGS